MKNMWRFSPFGQNPASRRTHAQATFNTLSIPYLLPKNYLPHSNNDTSTDLLMSSSSLQHCSILSLQTTPSPTALTPATSCPLGQIQALPRTQAHNYPPEEASAGMAAHKPSPRPTKAHGAKSSFYLVLSLIPSRSLPAFLYGHVGIPSMKGRWVTFLLYLTHYPHAAPTWNTH